MLVYELLLLYQLVLLKHAITNHYISYMKLHAWLLLIITHLAHCYWYMKRRHNTHMVWINTAERLRLIF